jgi:hypothetical protein
LEDITNPIDRLQEYLVSKRNTEITSLLQQKYSSKVLKKDLPVFCISNKEYSKYRDREQPQAIQRINLSGIPSLRRYCQLIPAAAQFDAVASYVKHEVSMLLILSKRKVATCADWCRLITGS